MAHTQPSTTSSSQDQNVSSEDVEYKVYHSIVTKVPVPWLTVTAPKVEGLEFTFEIEAKHPKDFARPAKSNITAHMNGVKCPELARELVSTVNVKSLFDDQTWVDRPSNGSWLG